MELATATDPAFVLSDVGASSFILIGVVALFVSILGGIGSGGMGLLIIPLLAPIVGIKAVIPLMAVSATINNFSRIFAFRKTIDRNVAFRFLLPALPGIVLGTAIYSYLPSQALYGLLGAFLILYVPVRRIMEHRHLRIGGKSMIGIGCGWGVLSGSLPGTGAIVVAALLGAGLQGAMLVGTKAVIVVGSTVMKVIMFSSFNVLTSELALAGILMGICMVPGSFIARWIVQRVNIDKHTLFIEFVIFCGGVSLLWRIFK